MSTRLRSKPNTPEKYLWHRGNIWWFRYGVPKRHQAVEGRKIIQKSLKTPDRHEASLLAAQMRLDLHARWNAPATGSKGISAGGLSVPNEIQLQRAATETAYLNVQPKFADFWKDGRLGNEQQHKEGLTRLYNLRADYVRLRA